MALPAKLHYFELYAMRYLFSLAFLASFAFVPTTSAQVSMSPRGSVTQTLDGTTITIDYARPRTRDRQVLFGDQLFWGHVWTPGANDATTIEFNKDIKIENVEVPAGKYSMWMVLQPGDWEVWLDPKWDQFHVPDPPRPDDGYFFWVKPDTTAPQTETLTFDFSKLENFGANLQLRWSNRLVDMKIAVQPSIEVVVTEEAAKPYVGTFATEVFKSMWETEGYSFDLAFTYSDGKMSALLKWPEGGTQEQRLLQKTDQVFYWAYFEGDELLETSDLFFEFDLGEDGMASSFELRTPKDELWMRGTRKSN